MLCTFRWRCVVVVGAAALALAEAGTTAQVRAQKQPAKAERSQAPPVTDLYPAGNVVFPSVPPPAGVAAGTQCDTNGNIYIQIAPPLQITLQLMRNHEPENLPLRRLSADSKGVVTFRANSAPDYKGFISVAFYVSPRGDVYNLATACRPGTDCKKPGDVAWLVTAYNDDGTVDDRVKLHPRLPGDVFLQLAHFAVFPDGNVLVEGETEAKGGGLKAFTAVFDRAGDLLSNLALAHDQAASFTPAAAGASPAKRKEAQGALAHLSEGVSGARFVGSPDGTVYLLRGGTPEKLYVLGSDGGVSREQNIKVPGSGLMPFNVSVNGQGQLVIFYISLAAPGKTSESHALALVDPQTGKVVSTYNVPRNAGAPACMTNQDVVQFVRESKSGHLEVAQYTPE